MPQQMPITQTAVTATTTLTAANSFTASNVLSIGGTDQLNLYVNYITGAAGAGNVLILQVEFSNNGTTWYQDAIATENAATAIVSYVQATHRFTGAAGGTTYNFVINIPSNALNFVRVGISETQNAGAFGTVGVIAVSGSLS